jgi:hypothetical protein
VAVATELTRPHCTTDPAASELDDLTPLWAASTAEASEIILQDSPLDLGGDPR